MEELRQEAMKALRRHKSGWIGLGRALVEVQASGKWKDWGYEKFWDYAKEELGLSTMTAKEMMTAYEYIKTNEPSTLNTIESNQDAYVPDYHTLASLSKVREKIGSEKEDSIRDTLFNATAETAIQANKEAKDLLAESSKKGGEAIMEDIKKKTKGIQKRVKKLDAEIHNTSSFDNEILETSEKLTNMIVKVEI